MLRIRMQCPSVWLQFHWICWDSGMFGMDSTRQCRWDDGQLWRSMQASDFKAPGVWLAFIVTNSQWSGHRALERMKTTCS